MPTKTSKSSRPVPPVIANSSIGTKFAGTTFAQSPEEPELQITYSYITPGRQSIEDFRIVRRMPAIAKETKLSDAIMAINVAVSNVVRNLRANRDSHFDLSWDAKSMKRDVAAVQKLLGPDADLNSYLCREGRDGTILPPKVAPLKKVAATTHATRKPAPRKTAATKADSKNAPATKALPKKAMDSKK